MGFRINTNVAALNAKANSDLNSRALDQSLSRLSSGLRINSAADDASGMAIADSLRSQANTLGQAISNGNDALGILQTADKAMDEQLKILDTIKTKATQAAQDGQSTKTRTMLQADINRLMEELDNIANTTSFNGKQLLSGGFTNQEFQIGASSNQTIKATIGPTQSSKIGVTRFETGDQVKSSGIVGLTIKNYNGIEDFKFQNVVISTSVGTGLGALAEEINRNADKTGVRATFNVQTVGTNAIEAGATSEDFAINGVIIGKVDYSDNDENGSLISAINAVKDTTGVQASKDENGKLVLTSADGRGIKITGNIGQGANIIDKENYGRLSLVKNDGRDINISGTNLSAAGFGAGQMISQSSVSLRESKGQINANIADAMGFNAYGGGATKVLWASAGTGAADDNGIASYMSSGGSGFSENSGFSVGSGKNMSQSFSGVVFVNSATFSVVFNASSGSGFSAGSSQSQFATMRTSVGNKAGVKDETAGVTTLKGAMAVMDIAETAITNLDQIRADIGSVQNQVTSTINNITVTQVNVKSAESQIRDVDFASESANYSKANILAQSGSYAMAQANSSQQNVLRLLQ
ncbi:flagellin [Campylobacter coli]|nr:flagellin [Campylobacter coli]